MFACWLGLVWLGLACFGWSPGPHLGGFGVVSGRVGLEGLFVSLPGAFKKTKEIQKNVRFLCNCRQILGFGVLA